MSSNYINLYQVLNDTNSYIKILSGQSLALSNISSIAQNRWDWIFNNWATLQPKFQVLTQGDQDLSSKLADMQRFIDSYRLGNKNNPLNSLENFVDILPFLDQIALSQLKLSPDEATLRDQETTRIANLDIEDFRAMMAFLVSYTAQLSQIIGLGDSDAEKVLGVQSIPAQRSATIQDLDYINNINQLFNFVERLLQRAQRTQRRPPNIIALSNQLVDPTSPIVFDNSFVSSVPQVFEISLEHMAQRYLGNRNLWFELVTINNLQPPYVDEVGTKYNLVAPGAANNVIISSVESQDVPVGTKIGIGSYRIKEEQRVVQKVILNEDNTMVLFLSGAQDVNKFQTVDSAFVRIYAPSTVRAGNFILIPGRNPSAISTSVPTPSRDDLRQLDKALLQFGVDIGRDDTTGDILIDPNGNFKLQAGLPNVRQTVLAALKTVRGELPFHPGFGLNTNIGGQFFGTTDEALIFGSLLTSTLKADPRFKDVKILNLSTTGTGIALSLLVYIAGAQQPLPLSFIS